MTPLLWTIQLIHHLSWKNMRRSAQVNGCFLLVVTSIEQSLEVTNDTPRLRHRSSDTQREHFYLYSWRSRHYSFPEHSNYAVNSQQLPTLTPKLFPVLYIYFLICLANYQAHSEICLAQEESKQSKQWQDRLQTPSWQAGSLMTSALLIDHACDWRSFCAPAN